MNKQFIILAGVLASSLALAQGAPPSGSGAPPSGGGGGGGGAPSSNANLDQTPMFNSIDANKDGKASKEEWKASGAPEFVYDMIDSKKAGSVTLKEVNAMSPPAAADADKDGKVTLDEMKKFASSMGSAPGGAPGGAPPAGGQPAAK